MVGSALVVKGRALTLILCSKQSRPRVMLLAPSLRRTECRKPRCSFHRAPSVLTMPVRERCQSEHTKNK